MEKQRIDELIAKYNEGLADPAEVKAIEQLIEAGELALTQLKELASLDEQMMKAEAPSPSLRADDQFYAMLAGERRKASQHFAFHLPDWNILFPRLALASMLIVAGFLGGYWLQRPSAQPEVKELTQQVGELKEMIMLSLIEKESASERLKAVSLTSDMVNVSDNVTKALFKTLNQDPNVNVRLAALEALIPFVKQSNVREELVRSISQQDSPLVQLNLAELMAAIQEKKSVGELQKLIESDKTPKEVKNKIRRSIEVLI